ncbi:hypothetical protein CPC197_0767B, partial [Chlamydia psittaci C1/97]
TTAFGIFLIRSIYECFS